MPLVYLSFVYRLCKKIGSQFGEKALNPPLEITVLGKPQLKWQGQPLTADLVSVKGQALLIYLAVTGQTFSRQALAGLLWGDLPEERARGNLRFTLNKLNKVVGDYLLVTRQSLAFDFNRPHWLDAKDFMAHTESLDQPEVARLQEALSLYQGEFCDDFHLPDAPDFETWMMLERERLHQRSVSALFCLVETAAHQQNWPQAIAYTRQILALEPWQETAHQQLMKFLAWNGQRSVALTQFDLCCRVLEQELGVSPAAETLALYEQLKQGTLTTLRPEPNHQPLVVAPQRPVITHNLPQPAQVLIGREQELAHISNLLTTTPCRLLTLVGPGGVGKTHLGLASAQIQLPLFKDGVYFVALGGVLSAGVQEAPDLFLATLAEVLNCTCLPDQTPQEALLAYLAPRQLLLLLDNFEPMLAPHPEVKAQALAFVQAILQHAPGVKLLVTSRERLDVGVEWLVDVQGLPYAADPAEQNWLSYPAVSLFVQHAQRILPHFAPQAEAQAINHICQLVAGFPLGIELAANWVRLLSCAEIAQRLAQDVEALPAVSPSSTYPHRHMRAVLDSSWELLTPAEQQLFCRLAVFEEEFSLPAAEQIAGATLALLNSLLNKSLLRRQEGGRYTLHPLLKQYGGKQLASRPGDQAETFHQHSQFYAHFLQQRRPVMLAQTDAEALRELDLDIENIRRALEWLSIHDTPHYLAHLDTLFLYYRRKGWLKEAVTTLREVCELERAEARQKGQWYRWLAISLRCHLASAWPKVLRFRQYKDEG